MKSGPGVVLRYREGYGKMKYLWGILLALAILFMGLGVRYLMVQ
ncbi:hypothetical protein [Paenibacillus sp. FJAT-26967]|nr:hypothetical protein [Paenibacillus sp. FJAT-26967]